MKICSFVILFAITAVVVVSGEPIKIRKRGLHFSRRDSLLPDIVLPSIATQPALASSNNVVPQSYVYPVSSGNAAGYAAYYPPTTAYQPVTQQVSAQAVAPVSAAVSYPPSVNSVSSSVDTAPVNTIAPVNTVAPPPVAATVPINTPPITYTQPLQLFAPPPKKSDDDEEEEDEDEADEEDFDADDLVTR